MSALHQHYIAISSIFSTIASASQLF